MEIRPCGPCGPPRRQCGRPRRLRRVTEQRAGLPQAPVVGMVGAGQLARVTYQASIPLGIGFRVLADRPDDSAALVCPLTTVGDYRRLDDLLDFATGCDVLTFDHEHVPGEHLAALAAAGVTVAPGGA